VETNKRSLILKVIFVGSHPDDIELGCGGAIAYFVEKGYEVWCIFLTKGEKGLGFKNGLDIRAGESIEALSSLGVNRKHIVFGNFGDTRIPSSIVVIHFLEAFDFGNPEDIYAVFSHSESDYHQDHQVTSKACQIAFRHVRRMLAFESPSVTSSFTPSAFIDISDYIRRKIHALRCHKSQTEQQKGYMEYKAMMCISRFRGHQIDKRYAEAFEIKKYLVT
jgi:LmbE family N-acetylglucosaminyl deacetylase